MRAGIRSQRKNVAECLRILGELEGRVKNNFDSMSNQMDLVYNIITPKQQARFLLWIERNKNCSFMLNNMWNHNDGKSVDEGDSASTMAFSDDGSKRSASPAPSKGAVSSSSPAKRLKIEQQK